MKTPQSFIPNKKKESKTTEALVNKTLVEKILVEKLADGLKEYLENQNMAERIKVEFEKKFDLTRDKYLNTEVEQGGIYISLTKLAKNNLQEEAVNNVLKRVREIEPDIKEEEITHTYINTFNIISNDFAYKLWLTVETYTHKEMEEEVPKEGKLFKGTKQVRRVYCNPKIEGYIKYAKFNKEHNEKLLQILKEEKYFYSIAIDK